MKRNPKIALGLILGTGLMLGTGALLTYIKHLKHRIYQLQRANTYTYHNNLHKINNHNQVNNHMTHKSNTTKNPSQSLENISNKMDKLDSFAQKAEKKHKRHYQQLDKRNQFKISNTHVNSKFQSETLNILYNGSKGHKNYFHQTNLVTKLGNLYRSKAWRMLQEVDDNSNSSVSKDLADKLNQASSSEQYNHILQSYYNRLNLNQASYPIQALNKLYSKCIDMEANNVYNHYPASQLVSFNDIETNGNINPRKQDMILDKYNDNQPKRPISLNSDTSFQAKSQANYEAGKRSVLHQLDSMFKDENTRAHRAMHRSLNMSEHPVNTSSMNIDLNHIIRSTPENIKSHHKHSK